MKNWLDFMLVTTTGIATIQLIKITNEVIVNVMNWAVTQLNYFVDTNLKFVVVSFILYLASVFITGSLAYLTFRLYSNFLDR